MAKQGRGPKNLMICAGVNYKILPRQLGATVNRDRARLIKLRVWGVIFPAENLIGANLYDLCPLALCYAGKVPCANRIYSICLRRVDVAGACV